MYATWALATIGVVDMRLGPAPNGYMTHCQLSCHRKSVLGEGSTAAKPLAAAVEASRGRRTSLPAPARVSALAGDDREAAGKAWRDAHPSEDLIEG
jgi:hypothetical protein